VNVAAGRAVYRTGNGIETEGEAMTKRIRRVGLLAALALVLAALTKVGS
jgi:hypothetical protein